MKTRFDSNEITQSLQELQPNILKQLVENAKRSHAWVEKSRGPIYKGTAESTLRNKRAYLRKVATDDNDPTFEWFDTFDDIYDSNNDNDNDNCQNIDGGNSRVKRKAIG